MASFFPNHTKCAICEKPIASDPVMFPAYLPKEHSLSKFADRCFHQECFEDWKHRDYFSRLYKEFRGLEDESIKIADAAKREAEFTRMVEGFDQSALKSDPNANDG